MLSAAQADALAIDCCFSVGCRTNLSPNRLPEEVVVSPRTLKFEINTYLRDPSPVTEFVYAPEIQSGGGVPDRELE